LVRGSAVSGSLFGWKSRFGITAWANRAFLLRVQLPWLRGDERGSDKRAAGGPDGQGPSQALRPPRKPERPGTTPEPPRGRSLLGEPGRRPPGRARPAHRPDACTNARTAARLGGGRAGPILNAVARGRAGGRRGWPAAGPPRGGRPRAAAVGPGAGGQAVTR